MFCPNCEGKGWTVEADNNDPTGQTPIQVQCDYDHALIDELEVPQ